MGEIADCVLWVSICIYVHTPNKHTYRCMYICISLCVWLMLIEKYVVFKLHMLCDLVTSQAVLDLSQFTQASYMLVPNFAAALLLTYLMPVKSRMSIKEAVQDFMRQNRIIMDWNDPLASSETICSPFNFLLRKQQHRKKN